MEIRTPDLPLAKRLLYQLSYGPVGAYSTTSLYFGNMARHHVQLPPIVIIPFEPFP